MALVGVAGALRVAVGAVRSIVTVPAVTAAAGPGWTRHRVTLFALSARITVPAEHEVTGTLYEAPEPVGVPTTQPVAVPVRVKSAAASPVTLSLNARA